MRSSGVLPTSSTIESTPVVLIDMSPSVGILSRPPPVPEALGVRPKRQTDLGRPCAPSAVSASAVLGHASTDALPAVLGASLQLRHLATQSLAHLFGQTPKRRAGSPPGRRRRRAPQRRSR